MLRLLFVTFIITASIVTALNAAPTPMHSQEHVILETINITSEPIGNHQGRPLIYNVTIGLTCVSVMETVLPTKFNLETTDPDYYKIVTYKSTDCNGENDILNGTDQIILNDRYPICSFKLNLENDTSDTGNVTVAFYLKGQVYSKTIYNESLQDTHDICNTHSGKHKFAERVTVYSDDVYVNEVVLFRESYPSHEPNFLPLIATNETDIVYETLKQRELIRSLKIIQQGVNPS